MTAPATTAVTSPAHWTPRLAPSRKVVTAGLLGAAATTSGLALTATSGWLIVRASARPVILTLLVAIVAVRTFGLARPLLRYAERLRSHDAALGDLAEQRTQVYAGLVPLTPARLGRRARSEVLGGVVDDLTDVVEAQARVTAPILAACGAAAAAAVLAALLLPVAGLVVSALLIAVAGLSRLAWAQESRSQQRLLSARAEVLRVSELVARQAVELQAIGAGGTAQRWLLEAQERFGAVSRAQSRGRALLSAGTLGATGVATVVTAWLVAGATQQEVSGPVAALLVLVPVAVGEALGALPDAMRALARAGASATRLARLLDQQPAVAAPALPPGTSVEVATGDLPAPAPHLRLSGVSAAWLPATSRAGCIHPPAADPGAAGPGLADTAATDLRAASTTAAHLSATDTPTKGPHAPDLAPLDLDLPPGRRVAVVGANGSGKSTLVAVLARQLDPAEGHYTVDGHDIRDLPLADVRELFAIVDDEPHVFATTLRENLRLAAGATSAPGDAAPDHAAPGEVAPGEAAPGEVAPGEVAPGGAAPDDDALAQALCRAGLGAWLEGLPDGLDTRLGTGGRGVSGGERARLGLARALLSGRPVLLLDEPVAHLDHATATAVLADLAASAPNHTVVMVTHRPEGLEHFDTVLDLSVTGRSSRGQVGG